jgi:hypothetical protein
MERQLQFSDYDYRRLAGTQADEVTAADFALDGKAEAFEETLDGVVKRGFQAGSDSAGATQSLEFTPDR